MHAPLEDYLAQKDLAGSDRPVGLDRGHSCRCDYKDDWTVPDRGFCITATARKASDASDEAVARISREVVVPLMAAIAELIGYDFIEEDGTEDYAVEAAILVSTIVRRERNPAEGSRRERTFGTSRGLCIRPRLTARRL